MNLLASSAALMIGIAAVLTFYTALLHLTRRPIRNSHKFRIVRDLIVGIQTLQLYFTASGLQFTYPFLLYPFVSLLFIAGTLNYIRYYMFLYPGGEIPARIKTQMIPAGVVLVGETWFYLFNSDKSREWVSAIFARPTAHPATLVIAAGVAFMFYQFFLLLRLELGFIRSENVEVREPVLISTLINLMYMLNILLITGGFIFTIPSLMYSGILLIGLTGIVYLLFENRYPHFYQLVAREEKQKKYKKSLIQGLSKPVILSRLEELMEDEKIYRQFELKLEDVAEQLLITPHQLSEFVNEHMGVNFSTYVNRYRVGEAKELLLKDTETSILSIGFQVGFGSKPSFNNIFKQQTGMTPSEFRKQKDQVTS